jgi:hypothetical protein
LVAYRGKKDRSVVKTGQKKRTMWCGREEVGCIGLTLPSSPNKLSGIVRRRVISPLMGTGESLSQVFPASGLSGEDCSVTTMLLNLDKVNLCSQCY